MLSSLPKSVMSTWTIDAQEYRQMRVSVTAHFPHKLEHQKTPKKDGRHQYTFHSHISHHFSPTSNPVIVPPARCRIRALDALAHSRLFLIDRDDGEELPGAFVAVADEFATGE